MRTENGPVVSAPAFTILLSICVSISLFFYLPLLAVLLISFFAASGWMLVGTQKITSNFMRVFFLILLFCVIFSGMSLTHLAKTSDVPSTVETEGKILMVREWGRRNAALIKTGYGRLVAYMARRGDLQEGAAVRLRGATFDFQRAEEKGGFDEFLYWRAKGAHKKIVVLEIETLSPPSGIYRWRIFLEKRIRDVLPERTAAYMLALTVGVRDRALSDLHTRAGTVHLLAVSGFHVGIVAAFAAFFLRRGLVRIIGTSVVVWLYVLFAGAPVGGVRAALMIQICLLAGLFGKPASAFNGVSAAGVLMLLYNPWTYFDVGWRLSILAALFLTALFSFAKENKLALLLASPLVWIVTAGQASLAFGEIPLAGLFINALAVPIFSFLFPLIFLLSLPALLCLPFAELCSGLSEYLLEAWEIFSEIFVQLIPIILKHAPLFSWLSCLLFAAVVLRASGYTRTRSAAVLFLSPFPLLFILRLL